MYTSLIIYHLKIEYINGIGIDCFVYYKSFAMEINRNKSIGLINLQWSTTLLDDGVSSNLYPDIIAEVSKNIIP